jgi:hypothetical protein
MAESVSTGLAADTWGATPSYRHTPARFAFTAQDAGEPAGPDLDFASSTPDAALSQRLEQAIGALVASRDQLPEQPLANARSDSQLAVDAIFAESASGDRTLVETTAGGQSSDTEWLWAGMLGLLWHADIRGRRTDSEPAALAKLLRARRPGPC